MSTPHSHATDDALRTATEDVVRTLYAELHHTEPQFTPLDSRSRLDSDLGFDSLARVELLQRLEHDLGLELPDSALESVDTLADLMRTLRATRASEAATPAREIEHVSTIRSHGGVPEGARTLNDVLAWRAERSPEATHAIVLGEDGAVPLSYAALLDGARQVAAGLARIEVVQGTSVALMLPTSIEYLHAFFGVLLAGGVPVPIYPPTRRSQLEEHVQRHAQLLANAGATVLVTFDEARRVAHLLRARVPGLRRVVSVPALRTGRPAEPIAGAPTTDTVALLQYTSGSTGSPKGVILAHQHLLANIRAMGASIAASERDVFVSWLPLYHDMGLIGAWLGSLYYGCLLVLMPPTSFLARPARWLRAIHDYRATLSAAPNFGYELAARRARDEELEGIDLSSLRITFNGAEPVYVETLERFRTRFAPFGFRPQAMTPVYGLAEVGLGLTFPPLGRGPIVDRIDRARLSRTGHAVPVDEGHAAEAISFVSSGRALPGYRVRIVDARGAELPERTEGDLQFAGPSATGGYHRNPEATALLVRGEWRDTGDRAYLADGELYVVGRAKDLIIRRGRHLYPEEIENAVGEIPGIRRGCVAAFGTRAVETGTERLVVVAETRETDAARVGELETRINERIIECAGEPADEIVLAPPHAVLKTSSGKLRRSAVCKAYEDGSLGHAPRRPAVQMLRLALGTVALEIRRLLASLGRLAYGVYAGCTFGVMAASAWALTMLSRSPARVWRMNHRAARALIGLWALPFNVTRAAPVDLSAAHVIVANHSSYLDSIILTALLAEPHCFVAKAELARDPLLASYLRRLKTLFVERLVREQSVAEVRRVREALLAGDSVAMFPEGTFTRTTGLRAFHLGAFLAAVDAGVPVIPLALCGPRTILRDGQRLPRRAPLSAVFGAPLLAGAGEDRFAAAVRISAAARAHILRYCGEPDVA